MDSFRLDSVSGYGCWSSRWLIRNTVWRLRGDGLPSAPAVAAPDRGGRTVIDAGYLSTMRSAKIVVTCNPTGWEGDFRLFEALSSGALVMVDRMGTPYHHPLIDGEHVVFYDHTNKTDLLAKLDHALSHPHWARKVGVKGYAHVLRHHRAVSCSA